MVSLHVHPLGQWDSRKAPLERQAKFNQEAVFDNGDSLLVQLHVEK